MLANLISLLGLHIVLIAPVWAQAPAVPGPPSDGAIGGIVAAVAILCLLVVIGVAVKLVDVKRNHEDEAAALQARISDALMMDRSLSGLTLTPVVQMPFRRGGLTSLTINGVVPTPELREAAIRLIMRTLEQAQASCRVEDRIVVDPTMIKHAA
ncbi:MAG TPA: hypothetical protein VMS64_12935 [Candidatus Methylomirabilis sp.]|nr:hypothetical protein [Candidatus Methylomirabilis sp.]